VKDVIVAIGWSLCALLLLIAMIACVRWARRSTRGASIVGSALVLLLGAGLVPDPTRQRIEEAREAKGKKGGESGDPPDRD